MGSSVTEAAGLTTTGVQGWMSNNLVGLGIFFIGLGIVLLANKGRHKDAAHRVGVLLIALFVLGLALDNGWKPLATQLAHLVGA